MNVFLTIVGLAFLILVHELGHFIIAKLSGVKVEEFGIGLPPRIVGKKIGETIYSVNALPLGGFVRLYGEFAEENSEHPARSFSGAAWWKRAAVLLAGVSMNVVIGWLLVSAVFAIGIPNAVLVEEVRAKSTAEFAGLVGGDEILGFDHAEDFVAFIKNNQEKEIAINIRSEGKEKKIVVTPRGVLGVVVHDAGVPREGLLMSLKDGGLVSLRILKATVGGIVALVSRAFRSGELVDGLVGPIGVFGLAGNAAKNGLVYFLQLLGIISLNLGVLNALPFPALDGGRLLFVVIEKIKGSPVAPVIERTVNAIGFALLMILIIAITARDIAQL